MFDSLAYLKKLEAVGVPRNQAEVQVGAMVDALNTHFSTKEDVSKVELSVRTDFARLRSEFAELRGEVAELRGEFAELRVEFVELKIDFAKLRSEFAELKAEFTKLTAYVEQMETRVVIKLVAAMTALLTLQSLAAHFLK